MLTTTRTALALAALIAVQASVYGGYKWLYPSNRGDLMEDSRRRPGESAEDYSKRMIALEEKGVRFALLSPVFGTPTAEDLERVRRWEAEADKATSGNPNSGLVLEVGGIPISQLVKILNRHRQELAQIPGYAGSGIDKDGIVIMVRAQHGEFPTELEGAKVHFAPPLRMRDLGAS